MKGGTPLIDYLFILFFCATTSCLLLKIWFKKNSKCQYCLIVWSWYPLELFNISSLLERETECSNSFCLTMTRSDTNGQMGNHLLVIPMSVPQINILKYLHQPLLSVAYLFCSLFGEEVWEWRCKYTYREGNKGGNRELEDGRGDCGASSRICGWGC